MDIKTSFVISATLALVTTLSIPAAHADLTPMEQLGNKLYFDANLSTPPGRACSGCHLPWTGFVDPNSGFGTSIGSLPDRWGNRNDNPSAYAASIPAFQLDPVSGEYMGGLFWDGRADSLEDQAKGPPLNPLEMNNADSAEIAVKLRQASYAGMFAQVFGPGALDDPDVAFDNMAKAIAAFERTVLFNQFTSKFDAYRNGRAQLSTQEARGLNLFEGKGGCAQCHTSTPAADGTPALFTNFRYVNLGVPRNSANPFYGVSSEFNPDGRNWIDLGLGGRLGDPSQNGKFRVPSLRNVALTMPYMHNGVFRTLRDAVRFHNTRDLGGWAPPEVPANVTPLVGNLGLTDQEVADIVAFLWTLTDGIGPYGGNLFNMLNPDGTITVIPGGNFAPGGFSTSTSTTTFGSGGSTSTRTTTTTNTNSGGGFGFNTGFGPGTTRFGPRNGFGR